MMRVELQPIQYGSVLVSPRCKVKKVESKVERPASYVVVRQTQREGRGSRQVYLITALLAG